jgi:hypothetical protein
MSGYANWSSSATYNVNDIVNYAAAIYVSSQGGNTNNVPSSSPTWWSPVGGTGNIGLLPWTPMTINTDSTTCNQTYFNSRLYILGAVGGATSTRILQINSVANSLALGTVFQLVVNPTTPVGLTINVSYGATSLLNITSTNFNTRYTLTKVALNNVAADWVAIPISS